MTPKDKAKDLFLNFTMTHNLDNEFADGEQAKQCALICVDEILKALSNPIIEYGSSYRFEGDDYWEEVKMEIEKL